MNYDQIITGITSGLTGNYEKDAKHLMAQYKIYENHEDYEKISSAIRVFMYNLIPNDNAFALKKIVNEKLQMKAILLEAESKMQRNNFNEALKIMELLINRLEKTLEIFSDDDINEFHNFDEFFEEQIYMGIFKPMKKMRQMPWHFASAYLKYGVILFELKEFDKAKVFLEKANKINPVNTTIMFELAELCKINNNWAEYIKITKKCFECAYSSEELARCYRNYGYYFTEQGHYETAIAAYCIATIFNPGVGKKISQIEIQYIKQLIGIPSIEIEDMLKNNFNEMIKNLKKHNVQLGANKEILALALSHSANAQSPIAENCILMLRDIAKYKEIYDLVGDKEINAVVDLVRSVEGKFKSR